MNMSHCRFENTLSDLQDCYESLVEDKPLSSSEQRYRDRLIALCEKIVRDFGEPENDDND